MAFAAAATDAAAVAATTAVLTVGFFLLYQDSFRFSDVCRAFAVGGGKASREGGEKVMFLHNALSLSLSLSLSKVLIVSMVLNLQKHSVEFDKKKK